MGRAILTLLSLLLTVLVPTIARAQDAYPSRPIRIIVPFGPGSATDVVARMLGETIRAQTGQQVIVDNKAGAFGIISLEEMARAKPDGYTMTLQNVSTAALTPQLYKKRFSIDFDKEIAALTRVVELPGFFNISTKHLPDVKTFQDLIAYSKTRPGQIRYATTGVGAFTHYEGELFQKRAGVKWEHIPMKEGPPAFIKGLLAGDVHIASMTMPSIAGLLAAGQLRALVTLSPQRLPEFPDIPTAAEAGFPGIFRNNWSMMFVHAQTPPPLLEAMFRVVDKAMKDEGLNATFKKQIIVPTPSASVADARQWLAEETKHWKDMIDEVKIEIEQ